MRVATTFYRRAILMARSLDAADAAPPTAAHLAPLTPGDIEAYRRFRPTTSASRIEARMARGDVAVAAWVDGRIVHAAWVATGRVHVAYLRRDLVLGPDEMLVYDSFTLPEFRRTGIAKARMMHVFREYRQRGYRRCLAILARENATGRRALESAGYRPAGRYACVRLGPLDHCWSAGSGAGGSRPLLRAAADFSRAGGS